MIQSKAWRSVWIVAVLWGTGTVCMPPAGGRQPTAVLAGIDVARRDEFRILAGQRVGLITNHTGRALDGTPTAQLLSEHPAVTLQALFSPEHGYRGRLDVSKIADSQDDQTGTRIYSLYGSNRRPTAEMLGNLDTLVFDIQDIGTRFYTYISTMGEAMKAADQHGKRFVVLDRPNPINGVTVSGPMLDAGAESFVGFHSLPVRHGMTIGELAKMFYRELQLTMPLEVVPCQGWRRPMRWDQTGLRWINPSPNMRSLTQAILYPGIGMLETTNLSVGRGTDTPFEVIGAPWIDPLRLAAEMRRREIPGVACIPIRFTPRSSKYEGEACGGLNFMITDHEVFDPLRLGIELATALQQLSPEQWRGADAIRLMGNRRVLQAILRGRPASEVLAKSREGLEAFRQRRARYLLYAEGEVRPAPGAGD
jgi:uncharacterized protein YbbC (DUF1343 family)